MNVMVPLISAIRSPKGGNPANISMKGAHNNTTAASASDTQSRFSLRDVEASVEDMPECV